MWGGRPKTEPPGVLNSQARPHTASSSLSTTVSFPTLSWLQGILLLVNSDSVFASFSSFQGITVNLLCDISSLIELRRVIGFQFVQLFSSCEDRSDEFQALYVSEQKSKVS